MNGSILLKTLLFSFSVLLGINVVVAQQKNNDTSFVLPFPWRVNDEVEYLIYKKNELVNAQKDTQLLDEQTFFLKLILYHQEDTVNFFSWNLFVLNKEKQKAGDSVPVDYVHSLFYNTNLKGTFIGYTEDIDSLLNKFEYYKQYIYKKQLHKNGKLIDQPVRLSEWYKTAILSNEMFIFHNFYGVDYVMNKKESGQSIGFTPWLVGLYNYDRDIEVRELNNGNILFESTYRKNMSVPVSDSINASLSSKQRKKDYKYATQVNDIITGNYLYYPNGLLDFYWIENVMENGDFKIINTIITELRTDI